MEKFWQEPLERKDAIPGDIIWIKPDLIALTDLNFRRWIPFESEVGVKRLANPDKIVVVVDHHTECGRKDPGAEHVKYLREWIEKFGVSHFYDLGRE
jgi:3-isopropylmalate/(R)-2-methylmalate dehydratase large subunit